MTLNLKIGVWQKLTELFHDDSPFLPFLTNDGLVFSLASFSYNDANLTKRELLIETPFLAHSTVFFRVDVDNYQGFSREFSSFIETRPELRGTTTAIPLSSASVVVRVCTRKQRDDDPYHERRIAELVRSCTTGKDVFNSDAYLERLEAFLGEIEVIEREELARLESEVVKFLSEHGYECARFDGNQLAKFFMGMTDPDSIPKALFSQEIAAQYAQAPPQASTVESEVTALAMDVLARKTPLDIMSLIGSDRILKTHKWEGVYHGQHTDLRNIINNNLDPQYLLERKPQKRKRGTGSVKGFHQDLIGKGTLSGFNLVVDLSHNTETSQYMCTITVYAPSDKGDSLDKFFADLKERFDGDLEG